MAAYASLLLRPAAEGRHGSRARRLHHRGGRRLLRRRPDLRQEDTPAAPLDWRPAIRNLSTISVDWKRRDAEYAVAVRAAASSLKDAPGRPVQVTRTAIGRAIGATTLLRQKLHKMPMTA